MKCFYHSDLDGHCSGAIVKLANPECEMFEINYGQPFPWELIGNKEKVYMVDFGLQPFSEMDKLYNISDLVWIDHHVTSLNDAALWSSKTGKIINGLTEIGKAGCELTWQYIYGTEIEMPKAVYLLGRYDVWDKSVINAFDFQLAMGLDDWNPKNGVSAWSNLFIDDYFVSSLLDQGKLLNKYQSQQNSNKAKRLAYEVEFDGLKFIAMNWSGNSQTYDSVYNPEKHDGMLMYIWDKDKWSYSLYGTNPDIDLSVIAKKYGGGGHKHACGFQHKEKLV